MRPEASQPKNAAPLNLSEKGRGPEGAINSDHRMFFQFHAFTAVTDVSLLMNQLQQADFPGALYLDVNDPKGIGVVGYADDPAFFPTTMRELLNSGAFAELTHKPEFTMFGRTYSIGYEPDLEEVLIRRPRRHLLQKDWPWAIWYPLRRKGAFLRLPADEQRSILMEHGSIGRQFGESGYAYDIRLACHGMDTADNDFVIGLMGPELYPLSAIVQRMRSTVQTSTWLEKLGPFFVGKVIYQTTLEDF